MQIPFEGPFKAYVWGMTYSVRDRFNRTILMAQVMKGDLTYRKNLDKLMHIIADLLNGQTWVEQGDNGPKLQSFGVGIEVAPTPSPEFKETKVEAVPEPVKPTVQVVDVPEEEWIVTPREDESGEDEDVAVVGGRKSKAVLEHAAKRGRGRPRKQ